MNAIEVSHVSKVYRRYSRRRQFATLKSALLSGSLISDLKADETFQALNDVSFSVPPGRTYGIIGPNGSGKSTMLKLVAGITRPTSGTVTVNGRISALIELGAGFHPEISGRENVFINGIMLGLTKREIAKRFDEIVEFAELKDFIDAPVKTYSSGMYMRLGFAVAIHVDPDVLLVDEVLAVGDTSFQQRCLEKMRSVQRGGATLVLVSHDLSAVEATCARTIWLQDGVVARDGATAAVLDAYRATVEAAARADVPASGPVRIMKAEVSGPDGGMPATHRPLDLRLRIESDARRVVRLYIGLTEAVPSPIFVVERDFDLLSGETEVRCRIDGLPVPRGRFALWAAVLGEDGRDLVPWRPVAELDVMGPTIDPAPGGVARAAPVVVDAAWEVGSR
jgi:ABC-type polysaccharide/polyol phosphate transport system ATPase subunit